MNDAYQKRKKWFIERVGKRVYRPPVKCNCESCVSGHINGVLISDEEHAIYLLSCEGELGIRYSDNQIPV